jgi:selenocysteine lyase/cysteine desulfurase
VRRRDFLSRAAVLGVATSVLRCKAHDASAVAEKPPDLSDWEAVRQQFPLDPGFIHMSQFFMASHPLPVRAAIEAHRRGIDENPFLYIEDNIGRLERDTRAAAAAYFGCQADDLAMTDSTTMGLATFYGGLQLREGQEILSTTHDHPAATDRSLDLRAARSGAVVRRIPLYQRPRDADADQMAEAIAREIRPNTRVVAVTWVHSGTGVKTPIARFAQAVAAANRGRAVDDRAILCVDGVHGFGIEDETASSLGCDMLGAGCHKWIFGPRGTGILWAKPEAWSVSSPTIPSFDGMWRHLPLDKMPPAARMTPGGFHSFEHRWALGEAFRFHQAIGKPRIARRIHELNDQCKRGLAQMKHLKLHTPLSPEVSAGIICFEVEGMSPDAVVERLKQRKVIASVTPPSYKVNFARLSPSLLTSPSDVEASLRAVRELA